MQQSETEIPGQERWNQYELEKSAWLATNYDFTHGEYQQAMQEIAQRCGV